MWGCVCRLILLLEQKYTNNHRLLLSARPQNGLYSSSRKPWELSQAVTSPLDPLNCCIDPGNGDNGCYSHREKDQTGKGNALFQQFLVPSAQPLSWFIREMMHCTQTPAAQISLKNKAFVNLSVSAWHWEEYCRIKSMISLWRFGANIWCKLSRGATAEPTWPCGAPDNLESWNLFQRQTLPAGQTRQ